MSTDLRMSFADLTKTAVELPHHFLADGLEFGESPRVHKGKLYMSDMIGKKIYTIDSSGHKEVLLEVEQQPNGMCFMGDGSLIYSSMFDAQLHRYVDGKSQPYADLSHVMTGYCGDMVIDRHGRVYVDDTGARVLHGETAAHGRLLIVEPDGMVKVGMEYIAFPNGISIDSTGKVLYNSESQANRLNTFDISDDGTLSNRRNIWDLAELSNSPEINSIDGICMDAEDGVWLAMLDHNAFIRRDVYGVITHLIKVDGHATACALGGDEGDILYLVTNKIPEGMNLFKAMVEHKSRCTVTMAKVKIPRGRALP